MPLILIYNITFGFPKWYEIHNNKTEFQSIQLTPYFLLWMVCLFIPLEILLHIFSYIPIHTLMTVISQVCKRWYILSSDPTLWRHLYIPAESSIDPHWLCYVTSRCPLLKSISLRGNWHVSFIHSWHSSKIILLV